MYRMVEGVFSKELWADSRIRTATLLCIICSVIPTWIGGIINDGAHVALVRDFGLIGVALVTVVCSLPVCLYCANQARSSKVEADRGVWTQCIVSAPVFSVLLMIGSATAGSMLMAAA